VPAGLKPNRARDAVKQARVREPSRLRERSTHEARWSMTRLVPHFHPAGLVMYFLP
jgi:hypothetical protein